jgi:hypothetical protein
LQKLLVIITPLILIASTLVALATADGSNNQWAPQQQQENDVELPNLLYNPFFEEGYDKAYIPPPPGHPDCPSGECSSVIMAEGWTPWWLTDHEFDHNPEYKRADVIFTDPVRVRSGQSAQQYFSFWSTHEAGFYQRVSVNNGQSYCFNIWGHAWSAVDDNDAYSGPDDGWLDQKVGIDPTGGTDPKSNNIIWGPPRKQYDDYGQFGVCAYALSDHMTVFTYSRPLYPKQHNDVYWDDAELFSPDLLS